MVYLWITTLIWAFSFGLIGSLLSDVNGTYVAMLRLTIALICFAPFLRREIFNLADKKGLMVLGEIGAVQFGLMYIFYQNAFSLIDAYLVAAFSAFTPLWVVLFNSIWERRMSRHFWGAAAVAVLGAWVLRGAPTLDSARVWAGFGLVQGANAMFALGQVWFRHWKFSHPEVKELQAMPFLYAGACGLVTLYYGIWSQQSGLPFYPEVTGSQMLGIVYLGAVASGLGFFCWNMGASRVPAGTLAVANNWVIPLGMVIAVMMQRIDPGLDHLFWSRLVLGGGLIVCASLWAQPGGLHGVLRRLRSGT